MEAVEPMKLTSYSLNSKLRALRKLTKMKLKTAKESNIHHLRAQGDSLKGACAADCSKFDFQKIEKLKIH